MFNYNWLPAVLCALIGTGCCQSRCNRGALSHTKPCIAVSSRQPCKTYSLTDHVIKPGPFVANETVLSYGDLLCNASKAPADLPTGNERTGVSPSAIAMPRQLNVKLDPFGKKRFNRAENFAWIVGQLEFLHSQQQWRVRYAACDVDDIYGGAIVICGFDDFASEIRDGAYVLVEGQLMEPDSRSVNPRYYVHRIELVE